MRQPEKENSSGYVVFWIFLFPEDETSLERNAHMKNRESLPGHLLYDIFNDQELTIHYLIDSFEEWKRNWRQVPAFITDAIENLAVVYDFDQHAMDEHESDVLEELKQKYPEAWEYLHPEGEFSKYHWDYARAAFWCRYRFRLEGLAE